MPGMTTSMRTTSGLRSRTAATASSPLRAVPATVREVSERTETDLLTLAARVALDALSEADRHAVLVRYLPETRTETAPSVTPVVTETPTSTASTARYATLEERTAAVRSTFTL